MKVKNSKIHLNEKATKILIKNGTVEGVETDKGVYLSEIVVSNAGLRSTVLNLNESEIWPTEYYNKIKELSETLKVVNIFMTFSRSLDIPKGFIVFWSV